MPKPDKSQSRTYTITGKNYEEVQEKVTKFMEQINV